MKKILVALLMLTAVIGAQAKVQFGVRGGYNITQMSFDSKVFSADNNAGFYLGPTIKVGLPLNLALDMSVLYDQRNGGFDVYNADDSGSYTDDNAEVIDMTRKTIAVPLNLRMSFGLGSVANVFIFAGPQFDFSLNKDIKETDFECSWNSSMYSVNVGAGIFLAQHFEVKVNYNIPCSESNTLTFNYAFQNTVDGIKGKTGAWQIGAAIYF